MDLGANKVLNEHAALNPANLGTLVIKTATASLTPPQQNVLVASTAATVTLTLPSVAEMIGQIVCIQVIESVAHCAVQDKGDDAAFTTLTSSASGYLVLLSNGRIWINLASSNFA